MKRIILAGCLLLALPRSTASAAPFAAGLLPPGAEAQIRPRIGLRHTAASYSVSDDKQGTWQSLTVEVETAPLPWFSSIIRQPVAYVIPDDDEGGIGLGNFMLGARIRLWRGDEQRIHWRLGIDLDFPTGGGEYGIGGGTGMFSPSLEASYRISEQLALLATLNLTRPLIRTSGDQNPAGSVPQVVGQKPRDAWGNGLRATYRKRWGYVALGCAWDTEFAEPGETKPRALRFELGAPVNDHLWLSGFYLRPMEERPRNRWQTGVALTFDLGASS